MKRETKIAAIVTKLVQGYTDIEIRQELNISKSTYFYWKKRIEEDGISKVLVKRRPGPDPAKRVDSSIAKKVFLWRDRYGWGPGKISGHLRAHHGIEISHHQIYRLLIETKRNKPIGYVREIRGKKRYERTHSMSLLHMDWKDVHTNPMLTSLDDHSRFITASEKFDEATMENSIKLLEAVIQKFGKPRQILTDRGIQFWNNRSDNPTKFTQFCIDNDIDHIKCSKGSPQANGKLEAFHGCYDAESWRFKTHNKFIRYWNYKRPLSSIGYLYPAEIFFRDGPINSG